MPINQTVTLLTEEDVAAPAATSMNQAIPVGKRFVTASMMRMDPANAQRYITDHYINGAILTVYFDAAPVLLEHEVRFVWAENFALTEEITTMTDNGDGTYEYESEDGTTTTIDRQLLQILGNVLSITPGNSITLPSEFANEQALTNDVQKLQRCLARLCRTCPQPGSYTGVDEE